MKISSNHRKLFILVGLFIIGFALYFSNLHGRLFWDDEDWIINNFSVHSFSWTNVKFIFSHDVLASIGLKSNYYRPFLFLTFMGNYIVSGISPLFYHLTNNIIHILNGLMMFLILDRFLKKRLVAVLGALLFIIHPLQTEAVAYISGRGDPLSVLLMLSSLVLFLFGKGIWQGQSEQKRFYIWLSYLTAVLAILSRETAVLFPLYLAIFLGAFVYFNEKPKVFFKKILFDTIPFLVLSGIYGVLRLTILNFQNTLNFYDKFTTPYTAHFSYRIYTFIDVVGVYLRLIFAPLNLHMERDVVVSTSLFRAVTIPGVIVIAVVIGGLFWLYKKYGPRSIHFRLWIFSWGVFFINLGPTSGVVPINGIIYEHWLYFSLFGFFTLLAYYLAELLAYVKKFWRPLSIVLVLICSGWISFLCAQTISRNILWTKPAELYADILKYEPNNVRALTNLGNLYVNQGNVDKAEGLYRKAIAADNTHPQAYVNLGNIMMGKHNFQEAIGLYKNAIAIDPNFYSAYQNLIVAYGLTGQLQEALDTLMILSKLLPNNAEVWVNLAIVENVLGHKDLARTYLQRAIPLPALDPTTKTRIQELTKILK